MKADLALVMMPPAVPAGVTASAAGVLTAARALGRFAAAKGTLRVMPAAKQVEST